MAPNGDEKAFTVTGKRYHRLQFGSIGEHDYFANQKQEERDREHGKRCERERSKMRLREMRG